MLKPSQTYVLELPFNRGTVEAIEYSDAGQICEQPVVSVVILAYAHEKWIRESVESVVAQKSNFEIELIVGEDCSPDRTRDILHELQEKYPGVIRLVTSQHNVRARYNLFRCERLCRGKYIAYMDGDDCWTDPEKIKKQVEYLENHPECGMVYTNADAHYTLSGQWTRMAMPHRPELCDSEDPYLQQLTGARIIWPLTVCLRKSLLDQITLECPEVTDVSLPMGDTPRFLEITRRTKIHYMPISTATRNLLPESATQFRDIVSQAQFIARCAKVTLHYLEKYPILEKYDRQVRSWVYLRELMYAYLCRDANRAHKAFEALRGRGIPVPLKYRLYYYGAVNLIACAFVKASLATKAALSTARKAL